MLHYPPPVWDSWLCRIDTTKRNISQDLLSITDILYVQQRDRGWTSNMLCRQISQVVSVLDNKRKVLQDSVIERHYQQVYAVLMALRRHKLYVKGVKVHFFVPLIKFCGHILSYGQRKAAASKLEALHKWSPDTIKTIRHMKAFLGLAQYYAL